MVPEKFRWLPWLQVQEKCDLRAADGGSRQIHSICSMQNLTVKRKIDPGKKLTQMDNYCLCSLTRSADLNPDQDESMSFFRSKHKDSFKKNNIYDQSQKKSNLSHKYWFISIILNWIRIHFFFYHFCHFNFKFDFLKACGPITYPKVSIIKILPRRADRWHNCGRHEGRDRHSQLEDLADL